MPKLANLIDRNKLVLYLLVIIIAFLLFTLIQQRPQVSIKSLNGSRMTEVAKLARENDALRQRLAKIEPASPVRIITTDQPTGSGHNLPALQVEADGSRIPFEVSYKDEEWVRPVYQPYWHSKQGQWSSMPDRIENSYHRLFVTPWTASLWNETVHEAGIAEMADKIKLSVYDEEPANTVAVVAIQYHITDVILLNDQVVLLGTPARTGVEVISINRHDLINSISGELEANNTSQEYLFQLATPDGFEIDYCNAMVNL